MSFEHLPADPATVDGYWNHRGLPPRGGTGFTAWTSDEELAQLAATTGEPYDALRHRRAELRVTEMQR